MGAKGRKNKIPSNKGQEREKREHAEKKDQKINMKIHKKLLIVY